uniref:Uncharacterized protein n=1 Tax=Panagrolaimus sp. PS1159 TaxID=55785 RepID=A0AC35FDF8_9BILA
MAIEECEESRQFERDLKLLDKLNNTKQVIPKNYLCRIGHDLHGHFDPQHFDFEILCGIVHTEKAAILLPYISGLFMALSSIFFIVSELYYCLPLMAINIPFLILLRYAIIKRQHTKMVPFLIFVTLLDVKHRKPAKLLQ